MLQIIVSGLIFGCIYGLTAFGLVLIYRTTGLVNFAQGEMAMISTFVGYSLLQYAHVSYPLMTILVILFSGFFGFIIYWALVRRVSGQSELVQLVLTLGIFLMLHGLAGMIWGHIPGSFPEPLPDTTMRIVNLYFTPSQLYICIVTLTLSIIIFLLLRNTRMGLALRAASQNTIAARVVGINLKIVFSLAWILGTILGGVAGLLTAPYTFLDVSMMFNVLIMAFAATVLAGFESLPGSVVGGMIIGVFVNLISYFWTAELAVVCTFSLITAFLYFKPTGIFGSAPAIKKV